MLTMIHSFCDTGNDASSRNSTQLVEAAFDGDLDEVKNYLDKGEFSALRLHLRVCSFLTLSTVVIMPCLQYAWYNCYVAILN